MIETLKVIINENGYYSEESSSSEEMGSLGLFLVHDIGCGNTSIMKQWLLEDDFDEYGTNLHFMQKEGNLVILKFEYAEDPENSECLRLPHKEFLHILNEWEKVCKERPKEVTIIREGDTFLFEKKF